MYFVMAFPTLIVLLFFGVLNWNNTVLYAPGDFEDEAMYLETVRLKKTLKSEIIGTLATTSADAIPLTAQQIEMVSRKVDNVIEAATASPREQQIIELLRDGPRSVSDISRSLNLNASYAVRVLITLASKGKVVKSGTGRTVKWSIA